MGKLSDCLAAAYHLTLVRARIDPHLTLKAFFEAKNIGEIERILEAFTKKERPEPLTLSGFDHFNGRVIFMNVATPKQMHMLVRRLQDQLRKIPWLTFRRTEFPLTLHATLCYPKSPEQAREVLSSFRREKTSCELMLDRITILSKEGDEHWLF